MKNIKKILVVFILTIIFGLCIPNNVRAEEVEESTEVMSDQFKAYLNEDGKFEITASKPKDILDFFIKVVCYAYENNLDFEKISFDFGEEIPDNFDKVTLIVFYETETEESHQEKHEVEIEWIYDEKAEAKINEIISDEKKEVFNLYDLETIDFYYNRHKMPLFYGVPMFNLVSSEAKSVLHNNNIQFKMLISDLEEEYGEGNEEEILQYGLKTKTFESLVYYIYNNSIYYTYADLETQFLFANLNLNHIFYVPSDTSNNVDAIREAAQKRINDYLKNDKVTLSYVSTAHDYLLQNVTTYENFSEAFNAEYKLDGINENDLVYHVEMKIDDDLTNSFDMIIRRDSSKMVDPSLKTVDLLTGVEVNTNSILPLDTFLIVRELNSGSEYENLVKLLNLTDSVTYDIELYSETLEKNITELEDGMFEVRIPIPEKLVGKDLVVYYVTDDGKIETYEVTVKDGYAVFKTNHFSIYTLSVNNEIENPKTVDNIGNSLLIGTISLILLVGVTIYLKREA